MRYLDNYWKTKKYLIFITLLITFVFSSFAFMTVSFVLSRKTTNEMETVPLYYEFKPNTLDEDYLEFNDEDYYKGYLSYGISYGIDVSEWQGYIDWERVKKTGISFAMIRCGYRQTHGSEIHEDATFRQNIEGAIKAGLKVGVYFFGTAKNQVEALEEADFTLNLIKDYDITYPIVYDTESFNTGRLEYTDYSAITDNVLTFTETIASYGYETMIYSYKDAFSYMLDTGKFEGKLIWMAHFSDKTDYRGEYNMWQYSETGHVDGITGNVDLNISYFTYVDKEEDIKDNPHKLKKVYEEMQEVHEQVKTVKKTTYRLTATDIIPNKLGEISYNTILIRTGIGPTFSRVEYNGRQVYVANDDLRILE